MLKDFTYIDEERSNFLINIRNNKKNIIEKIKELEENKREVIKKYLDVKK